ncbi:MAG: hypothetical protein QMD36_05040, partial [Candidatus Aenigmarchaeota archaeon]|nr:hypothetical protein [Candidatus Aenigmarchaeota archaeon]
MDKDDAIAEHVYGDGTTANRQGAQTILFQIRINDTDRGAYVEAGFNCSFWFTSDGSTPYDYSFVNQTNASGYCEWNLDPNCSYTIGNQKWIAGGVEDPAYKPDNITQKSYTVKGQLINNLTKSGSEPNGEYRYESNQVTFKGYMEDDCGSALYDLGNVYFYGILNSTEQEFACTPVTDRSDAPWYEYGWYNCTFNSTSKPLGWYQVKMNSSETTGYYGGSTVKYPPDSFYLENKTTSGILLETPQEKIIDNITQDLAYTFDIEIILNNTGTARMLLANITNIAKPAFWSINTTSYECGTINISTDEWAGASNCTKSFKITLPANTQPGIYWINFTGNWSNPNGTLSSVSNRTKVNVTSNPILEVEEAVISGSVDRATEGYVNNFTVNSTGNDVLENITFSCISGTVCTDFTLEFNPVNISSLVEGNWQSIAVNATIPVGYAPGVYNGTIRANATGTSCDPASQCWDDFTINITVINTAPTEVSYKVNSTLTGLATGGWGEEWNYSVTVNDINLDNITLKLFVNTGSGWVQKGSQQTVYDGYGSVSWLVSDFACGEQGLAQYKFEYNDSVATGNFSVHNNPNLTRDDVSVIYISGNETQVNRNGTASVTFQIRINDTDRSEWVGAGVNASLWVTTDGSTYYKDKQDQLTDSLGYSNITFDPSSSIYNVGKQLW